LAHGGQVLLFLNGGSVELPGVSFPLSLLSEFAVEEAVSEVTCRDLWRHEPCTSGGTLPLSGNITVDVEVHGVVMVRLTPKTRDGAAQAMASLHDISAADAVAQGKFAAREAFTYHAALNPPGLRTQRKPKRPSNDVVAAGTSARGFGGSSVGPSAKKLELPAAAAAAAGAPAWAMRGGDATHSGRSPFRGPTACPTVAWTSPLGEGNRSYVWTESSAAVDGSKRLFVGSGTSLWALALEDGAVLWQVDTTKKAGGSGASQSSEFFGSPALHEGLVLAGTGAGTMYAFYAANGSVAWSVETGDNVVGSNGGTGKAPITGSVAVSATTPAVAYFGAWDGIMYALDPNSGAVKWKYQAMDADTATAAQIRATPAVSGDGSVVHFPAGRALYALDAATGKEKWVLQTVQVMYTSPTVAPDGTVIYGASGGGVARAVSAEGKQLWEADLQLFASTMGAITTDGEHVLLANASGLAKIEIKTGATVWSSKQEGRIAAAAIVLDSDGRAYVPNGHGISFTSPDGLNTTNCDITDPSGSGFNSLVSLTLAADGMVLQLSIHGMMKALVG
jgi:outer membrane protein assembly factor BamB